MPSEVKVPEDLRLLLGWLAPENAKGRGRALALPVEEALELVLRLTRVEQERDQLRASHAELLEALKCAKEFIENQQLPDEEWSRVLDVTVEAIKNGSQAQAENGSSV